MKLNEKLVEMASVEHDLNYFMFLLYEMVREQAAACNHRPFTAVELGVRHGNSTVAILAGLARVECQMAGWLHSCDIEPCRPAHEAVREAGLLRWWIFEQKDSITFAESLSWCDFVFVDTSHEAKQTKAELAVWTPKVSIGGRIVLHDTCSRPGGVGAPFAEFLAANLNWTGYNIDVNCGLGVARKVY